MSSRVTTSPGRASISDSSWNGCSAGGRHRCHGAPRAGADLEHAPNCIRARASGSLSRPSVAETTPVTGVRVMWPRFRHVSTSVLGGIEAHGAGAHCWGMSTLAAALVVMIRVYDVYGLSPETRQEALAMTAESLGARRRPGRDRRLQRRRGRHAVQVSPAEGEIILRLHRRRMAPRPRRRHRRWRCRPEHDRHRLRRGHRRTVRRTMRLATIVGRVSARDRAPAARHQDPHVARPDAPIVAAAAARPRRLGLHARGCGRDSRPPETRDAAALLARAVP